MMDFKLADRLGFLAAPIPGLSRLDTGTWWGVVSGLLIGVALGLAECYAVYYFVMSTTGGFN